MRLGVILAALAGLAGAAYLIFVVGFSAVWNAITHVGWPGFGALWLYGAGNFILLGTAWMFLVPPYGWGRAAAFWWARAVRDSAGDVLPFSQLGGMLIGARAVMLRGFPASLAFGSMVVDVTVEMVSQICFIVLGIALLLIKLPLEGQQIGVLEAAVGTIFAGIFALGAFVVAQRRGFTALEKIASRLVPDAAGYAAETSHAIATIHGAPRNMVFSFVLHFTGWAGSGFGTWLALELIGKPLAFSDAVAIEGLMCALRSAVVFVPGAYGVQEAGYTVLLPLFGLPPQIGLAISLLKRAREIAVGVPVLISWQIAEGGHAALARDLEAAKAEG